MVKKRAGTIQREIPPYLGPRLRALREAKGLAGTAASEAIGVKKNHLYCVERGEKMLSLEAVQRAAEFYGVDIGWLLEPAKSRPRKRT